MASTTAPALGALLSAFEPLSLEELDGRAALQQRVDHKYVVERDRLGELLGELTGTHQALEIDGRRDSAYDSVYFDTPDLLCFREHVEGTHPRMKVRSRLYAESGSCSFEVKLKPADGETVKRHLDYDAADHGTLTPEARRFLEETLRECVGRPVPEDLAPSLTTRFRRATIAARDGSERVTCDADLRLIRPDGRCARLRPEHVVVEAKSSEGDGRADRLLRDAGLEPVSLSKYRTGIALLADVEDDEDGTALFRVEPGG